MSRNIYGDKPNNNQISGTCPLQITDYITRINAILTQLTSPSEKDPVLANRRLKLLLDQMKAAKSTLP